MRVIFTLIAALICYSAYSQVVKNFDSHQFIKKIDSNKVYFKNSNQSSVSKHKAIQLLDSIYNFKSFIDYDSIFIKFEISYHQCFSDEFNTVYFLKEGKVNLKNYIALHSHPCFALVDDTSKGKNAKKWQHYDFVAKATLIENKSLSTKKAFQLLDSIYNFKSYIDYDSISIQWKSSLCNDFEHNYFIYFLKDGFRNLNYHIFLNSDFFASPLDIEENGLKNGIWRHHENIVSAKIIEEKVERHNDGLCYAFEDLSTEKYIHVENPNKYISCYKMDKLSDNSIKGKFQITFNEKEVFGIEIDSLKKWELASSVLNFDKKNYSLKVISVTKNIAYFTLYFKGIQLKNCIWEFSNTPDIHWSADGERYAEVNSRLNISGYYPPLNLNPSHLIGKRKATKIAKSIYKEYKANANIKFTDKWPKKPNFENELFIEHNTYVYYLEFRGDKCVSTIKINGTNGSILSNSFKYKHLNSVQ